MMLRFLLLAFCFLLHANTYALADAPAKISQVYRENIPTWSQELAHRLISVSLRCVEKEYPHQEEMLRVGRPQKNHPSFYGCYDWHSSVHAHWSMVRVLKSFPGIEDKEKIEKILTKHFSQDNIQAELNFIRKHPDFEMPYGYAWFFRLLLEIDNFSHPKAQLWRKNLKPLEDELTGIIINYFSKLNRPLRMGMHDNTAFALIHFYDFSLKTKNKKLEYFVASKARLYFSKDVDCPISYEPSGTDFLSPCFAEADLMRRLYSSSEYAVWLNKFLSLQKIDLASSILSPVVPEDPKDSFLGHLIGLMFSKASSMAAIAAELPPSDPRKELLERAAQIQVRKGVELMFDSGYGGEHWLATYAIFYFSKAYLN